MTDLDPTPNVIPITSLSDSEDDGSDSEDEEEDADRHWFPERIDTVVHRMRGFTLRPAPQPVPLSWPARPLTEVEKNTLLCLIITCVIFLLTASGALIGGSLKGTETVNLIPTVDPALTTIGSNMTTDPTVSTKSKNTSAAPPHNTSQPTPNFLIPRHGSG